MEIDFRKWKFTFNTLSDGSLSGLLWNIDDPNQSRHYFYFGGPYEDFKSSDPEKIFKDLIKKEIIKLKLSEYITNNHSKEISVEDNLEYLEKKYDEQQSQF